jgi:anti-sigma regulatory factor (Ser/Thr protein kinase)
MTSSPTGHRHPRFLHSAVFHHGPDELAGLVRDDVLAAVGAGDAVLVSAPEATWSPLAAQLGDAADAVRYVPHAVRFTQPTVALKVVHDFVRERITAGARSTMSIGVIPVDGDAVTNADWVRYESSVRDVLGHLPLRGVCAYDLATTPPAMVAGARCTHDVAIDAGGRRPLQRAPLAPRSPVPIPTAAPDVHVLVESPAEGRGAIESLAGTADPVALDTLRLVVSELVTNALRHGGAPVCLSAWPDRASGTTVVDVSDGGDGIADPYFELRPPVDLPGGAGLWIVGQLVRRVTSTRAGGTHHVTALVTTPDRRDPHDADRAEPVHRQPG